MDIKPKRIIDPHIHLYPARALPSVNRFFQTFPLPKPYKNHLPRDFSVEAYREQAQQAGITIGINLPVAKKEYAVRQVAEMNDWAAATVEESSGAIASMVALNPHLPINDVRAELDRLEGMRLLRWVKLHPLEGAQQAFDPTDKQFDPLYAELDNRGYGICWHMGIPPWLNTKRNVRCDATPEKVRAIMERYRGLRIQCAHLGGWKWERTVRSLGDMEKAFFDFAYTYPFIKPQDARRIASDVGVGRLLGGSDYPSAPLDLAIDGFNSLGFTPEEEQAILWENPTKIYGIAA